MVRCFVQVAADPDPPRPKDYEFVALPRIGDWVTLGPSGKYQVVDVDHLPAGVEKIDDWVNPASVTVTIRRPGNA